MKAKFKFVLSYNYDFSTNKILGANHLQEYDHVSASTAFTGFGITQLCQWNDKRLVFRLARRGKQNMFWNCIYKFSALWKIFYSAIFFKECQF